MKIENKVLNLIEDVINEQGINVDKILLENENDNNYLRIIIDKEPYVDIDDCVKITELINPILDKFNLIKDNYILDVCSKEKGGEKNGC